MLSAAQSFFKTDLAGSKGLYKMIGFIGTVFSAMVESIFEVNRSSFRRAGEGRNEDIFVWICHNFIHLRFKNHFTEDRKPEKPETSDLHGWGIRNMKHVIGRYNGEFHATWYQPKIDVNLLARAKK